MKTKTVHVKLGMRRSYFAPITARPGTGHPTYGTVLDMGEAVLGHLAVTYATGDIFGDDASRLHVEQFISGQLDTETTCSELELAAAVYGRTFTNGVETSNKDDAAPDGGYGYIEPFLKADKTMVFRAVFLYNVTPMPSQEKDDSDTRKGDFNPVNNAVSYFVAPDDTGDWRDRQEFNSEAAADAWLMSKFGSAAGHTVTVRTTGAGTVTPAGASFVAAGEDLALTCSVAPTKVYDNSADVTSSVANKVYTIQDIAADHDVLVIFPAT